jgi:hypothetical protein
VNTDRGLVRLDIDKPDDLQLLIDRGLIWRSGPKTLQKVFKSIQNGDVQRRPDREPPEVRTFLDKVVPVTEEPEDDFMDSEEPPELADLE